MNRAGLRMVGRLVWAQARRRPGRVALTTLATIAAACVVVWVVSGYDSLIGQFGDMGEKYLGRYDLLVLPTGSASPLGGEPPPDVRLADDLIGALRADPAVATVDPTFETRLAVRPSSQTDGKTGATEAPSPLVLPTAPGSGPIIMGGMTQLKAQARNPVLVGTDSAEPLHPILQGRWFDPRHPDGKEAAITHDSAEALQLKLGDEVDVLAGGRSPGGARLRIVAILDQPKRLPMPRFMVGLPPTREAALRGGPVGNAVYVPSALARQVTAAPLSISYAGVVLKGDGKATEFLARWSERLARASPPALGRTLEAVGTEVDNSTTFETVRIQAYSAVGISLLAALFIIFTTLSMGVAERVREFAMLRAVALTKSQVGAMVVLEGTLLGLIGWGGGLLAGGGLIHLMARLRPESVAEGATLGRWCIILSGVCSLGGSLAACVLPVWQATRITPLEAMAQRSQVPSQWSPWLTALVGLPLIAINPLVTFVLPIDDPARYGVAAAVGCTTMAVGFVLLAPLAVVMTEQFFGPVVALALGLSPRLLAAQLSSNMGRTVGTTVALTIGLGLYVAMQTWGYSMLGPFTPGPWTPDLIVSIAPVGVPESEVDAIRHVPGVTANQFVPLAVKQVKFAEDLTGFRERPSATRQDTCVMVGVDPDVALGGARPMFDFPFVEGTRIEAIAQLKRGRYCLVPDHFAREAGLGLGGRFAVIPPATPDKPVAYEIAGVVSMPGWHWMSKIGFRRGRAAGLMFALDDQVRRDFDTGRPALFWMNMDGTRTEEAIKAAIEPIAARSFDPDLARTQRGRGVDTPGVAAPPANPGGPRRGRPAATVTLRSAASVRAQIRGRADGIIGALSQLPLVTLAVTSIGVINTVVSSVRARRWDMGMLRAVGVTRFGLARLIIAEALLVGAVACLLSLGFGTMAGYCGTGITRYVNIRGGQYTPLIIPWDQLWVGFAATLGLCLVAGLWPAITTGRTEPLKLLQAGRAPA